ncbi:hypothetical protein RFI_15939, partial [Reticulomyxa filosa]
SRNRLSTCKQARSECIFNLKDLEYFVLVFYNYHIKILFFLYTRRMMFLKNKKMRNNQNMYYQKNFKKELKIHNVNFQKKFYSLQELKHNHDIENSTKRCTNKYLQYFYSSMFNLLDYITFFFLKKFSDINNMGNRNTSPFQSLKKLPTPLDESQCVIYKHELLICGGSGERACYSYHILKNEYNFICDYPSDVKLYGHCVVKLVDNNQTTLLSFGGSPKHTLVMKYVSVWSNISNKSNEFNNYNQWIPFTDSHNFPIQIGRDIDDYYGMRAMIGGMNNNLLFITYYPKNISVFDLNTFQFIKHDTLPTDNSIFLHCFVSNSENGQGQKMIKTNKEKNKQNYQMLLFYRKTGLSIGYNEDNNIFQFHKLPVCEDIASFCAYAYVYVNDVIFFFGGLNYPNVSKLVHEYSIQENKWITFENTLPGPLRGCVAILSEEDYLHIIGGQDDKTTIVSTHIKTKVRIWDPLQLLKNEIKCIIRCWLRISGIKLGWIDDFDKIILKYREKNYF